MQPLKRHWRVSRCVRPTASPRQIGSAGNAARRAEATSPIEDLRQLGPELEPNQVLLTVDEVLTRRPEAGHFLELRTARIMTERGSRILRGIGALFLQHLHLAVIVCLGSLSSLLLIADRARPIRNFFTDTLAGLADKTMILDWHHLKQKCLELGSRICRSKLAKAQLLRRLYRRLWRGDVAGAIVVLEAERGESKNEAKLDELIRYLQARQTWTGNYRQRWIERHYIGSAHVEKANDVLVARRQKNRGMQWSEATSDALAALRTLMRSGGWERYWQQREVLPLLAACVLFPVLSTSRLTNLVTCEHSVFARWERMYEAGAGHEDGKLAGAEHGKQYTSCQEWQDLTLLPISLPAAVEHQRAQRCERITRGFAPLHPPILLPARDDQVIRLLHMGAADILLLDASLSIIRDPRCPRLQVGNQFIQLLFVPGLTPVRFQHCDRLSNLATP
jgi:hypothetical protein